MGFYRFRTVAQHKFSRADQIKSLASATYITHNGVTLEIDPWAIYQRFVVAGLEGEIGIDLMFKIRTMFISSIPL